MLNINIKHKKNFGLGLIICCVLLSSCVKPENAKVRQGNRKFNNKNYSDAEKKFKKALRKSPNDFNANFNLANSLIEQGKFNKSDSILLSLPDSSLTDEQLADLYFNQGSSMLMHYMRNDSLIKAIDNGPKSIRNHIIKDSLSKEMGQLLTKSINSYKNTLRSNPKDEEARYNLSYANHLKPIAGQGGDQEQQEKMEPSEFAKKIKARADSLNNELEFYNAFATMVYGAQQDSTVMSYQKYMQKMKEVLDIDTIQ